MQNKEPRDPNEVLRSKSPEVQRIIKRVIQIEYANIHWKRPPRILDELEDVIKKEVK